MSHRPNNLKPTQLDEQIRKCKTFLADVYRIVGVSSVLESPFDNVDWSASFLGVEESSVNAGVGSTMVGIS